jgi:2-hydroxy-6-oxonona-2,4-dienedioate hydrolase
MWAVVEDRPMHARVSIKTASALPPVVLVHGLGVSSHYMVPTALELAPACSVYAVDLPGFGKSARPAKVLDVPGMADALDAWMYAVGLDSAVFIGNSIGCQVVVDLAVRYPGRVDKAVLTGPTFDRAARRSVVNLLLRVAKDGRWEPRSLSPIIVTDYLSAGLVRIVLTLRYALRDPIEEKLRLVAAPSLIVRGEHDSVVPPAWVKYMARVMPRARMVTILGASHAVNFSSPAKLARLVMKFCDKGTAGREPGESLAHARPGQKGE